MSIAEILQSLLDPLLFLSLAASYLPATLLEIIHTNGLPGLSSWHPIRNAWFTSFWRDAGQKIREGNEDQMMALLQGRVSAGKVVDGVVSQGLSGVVVDVGPGVGFWIDVFATVMQTPGEAGMRVFGVEPSADAHGELRRRVKAAGMEDFYEVLPCGIESLSGGVGGSVDCVVSVLCLCSIPDPERGIRELYRLLKPGGRWFVYEHVRVKRSWFIALYQRMIGLIWPHFIGGCQLTRDTESSLRNAGPWTKFNLAQPVEEPWHQVIPHVYGILTK